MEEGREQAGGTGQGAGGMGRPLSFKMGLPPNCCFHFSLLHLNLDLWARDDLQPNPPFPLHASFNCFLHFL